MYVLNVYFGERDRPNEVDDDYSWQELMDAVNEDAAVFWDRDMAGVDMNGWVITAEWFMMKSWFWAH
jgi:hypothetical protein